MYSAIWTNIFSILDKYFLLIFTTRSAASSATGSSSRSNWKKSRLMFCDCRTTNVQVPPSPHLYTRGGGLHVLEHTTPLPKSPHLYKEVDYMYKYIHQLIFIQVDFTTYMPPPFQVTPALCRWITYTYIPQPLHILLHCMTHCIKVCKVVTPSYSLRLTNVQLWDKPVKPTCPRHALSGLVHTRKGLK